jgi:hypothetical protein
VRAVGGLLDAGDAEMVAAVGAIMERLQSDGRQPGALFRVLTGR